MSLRRSPLFWILLLAAALRLAGLFWGLPASDGWDDDGFAPRNFLTALVLTWKPDSLFTYPPLHALILALPSLPVAGWALGHAPSFSQHDIIATIIRPGYATWFALVARLVSVGMSLGIIWVVSEMARLMGGPRAALFAGLAAALNMALTYYGQVSNLDVPYLFWGMLSLLAAMRAIALHEPKRFWHAALLAGAAVATKDQASALFLLGLPLAVAAWFADDAWPRRNLRAVLVPLLAAALAATFLLLLVDGAITNPSGFLKRIAFLAGPASGDYAQYIQGPRGWLALLGDMAAYYIRGGYGAVAVLLAGLGLAIHWKRSKEGLRAAGLVPLLAAISFTLCFNFAALRSDDRFLMPQAVMACVYIGIGCEILIFAAHNWLRLAAQVTLAVTALLAFHQCFAVDAAMLMDPRYDAGAWLAAEARPGDGIEVYDRNWMLPAFPPLTTVLRVGPLDPARRAPLPGVIEVRQAYGAPRDPRFVLVSSVWARRYLEPARPLPSGHIYSRLQLQDFRNSEARIYFARLASEELGYRLAHVSHYQGLWPPVRIHDSLNESITIYERRP